MLYCFAHVHVQLKFPELKHIWYLFYKMGTMSFYYVYKVFKVAFVRWVEIYIE